MKACCTEEEQDSLRKFEVMNGQIFKNCNCSCVEAKQTLRKMVIDVRKALTPAQILERSRRIAEDIMLTDEYKKADCIYAYMPAKGEVDVTLLIDAAWCEGKRVAVPKVIDKELFFYYINSYDELCKGCFGIQEPVEGLEIAECNDALLIIPGVAFDRKGHRIGYGGGFYDRYLCKHTEHFVMAPAYDFQVFDEILTEAHDISVNMVVSDERQRNNDGF